MQDANARKGLEAQLAELKSMIERWGAEIPKLQASESEALGQLRTEQARHTELQETLDRVDQSLAALQRSR